MSFNNFAIPLITIFDTSILRIIWYY